MLARLTIIALFVLLLPAGPGTASGNGRVTTVAVFPVENLSAGSVPADEIRQFLAERLTSGGVGVLASDALEEFMARHRVRYAAGIDSATAEQLKQETGVDGVVIASVELSSDAVPPKVALIARLVSTQAGPAVIWAGDAGLAGDDAPGLLDLGVVNDYQALLTRALSRLADSLLTFVRTGNAGAVVESAPKFRPRTSHRSLTFEPGRSYSVAVLPFFNRSPQRNAGEILALLFMRHLSGFEGFRVIDAGDVRQQLLQARVIMDGGVSIKDSEQVGAALEADFILGGRVLSYEDQDGPDANPRVEFSTTLIERKTRKVVWSSRSYNEGFDGVRYFGRGRVSTAHAMATQMVRLATEGIVGRAN